MAVVINGTTGVSGVDGSAGTPSYQGTDSNTGIFFPAADTIAFAEGGAEAMRIDSSGNVLVGATALASSEKLLVSNSVNSTSNDTLVVSNPNTSSSGVTSGIGFFAGGADSSRQRAAIRASDDGAGVGRLMFYTREPVVGAMSERARITSGGDFVIGATSSAAGRLSVEISSVNTVAGFFSRASGDVGQRAVLISKFDNNTTTSQIFIQFGVNNANTNSGQINANGASQAAFGSYSDRRLKENIIDLPSQLANICALRPVEFDYIESEGGGHQISFIAQEFEQVYPEAVGERADGMKTLTGWGKTEAYLVKAIQELKAITDAQTTRIEALEAEVAALKGAN